MLTTSVLLSTVLLFNGWRDITSISTHCSAYIEIFLTFQITIYQQNEVRSPKYRFVSVSITGEYVHVPTAYCRKNAKLPWLRANACRTSPEQPRHTDRPKATIGTSGFFVGRLFGRR